MQRFSLSPKEMFESLWRNKSLINVLVKRDIVGRYRGSIIGIFWSFFNPVLMLLIYTYVFGVIFKSSWTGGSDSKLEFALVLFAGLIVFNLFSECINCAPKLVISNVNYVKKVVFPLEILPWVSLGSAIFHALVSLLVWFLAYLFFYGLPHASVFLFPLMLMPLVMIAMGLSWFLSSLGVYLRDVSQLTEAFTKVLMFMSPIFYSAAVLPEKYRYLLWLNPLASVIENVRDVLFWGRYPDFLPFILSFFFSFFTSWLGFVWFQKTRKGFADVL